MISRKHTCRKHTVSKKAAPSDKKLRIRCPKAGIRSKQPKQCEDKGRNRQTGMKNTIDRYLKKVTKGKIKGMKSLRTHCPKLFVKIFPYMMFAYFGNKMAYAYRITEGADFFDKLMGCMENMGPAFRNPLPSINMNDLLFGALTGAGAYLVVYLKGKNAKKFRKGMEYGSARWGTAKDIEPYMDLDNPDNNIPLTQTEGLMMSGKPKLPKYGRNKNILVIGGSGSGKTRFFVKPSIMQMHSSYVITDPKGTLLYETGKMLQDNGYEIKVLNTINFSRSMHYNPFAYIHSEKDILKLVNTLMANTKGEGTQSSDEFWTKAEKLLYQAYIGYIYYECIKEEQNFSTLIDMINASETREGDENYKNAIDLIFEELEKEDPNHFAVRQYRKFKLAAGKTLKSILIQCGARMAPFDIQELRDLTEYDEMELDQLGERKTALFLIMSDTDTTFNFILAILQSQMFNILCECADDKHNGRLPVHVRCLLDEFCNIGQIPQFEKLIATIRSREISASIIVQAKSQLKSIYKDNADTIEGNCDVTLFLGGKEKTTLKELNEVLGKETIDLYNTSDTRGNSPSYGLNYQKTGHDLLSMDEIAVMDGGKCIMQLRGVRPFFSDKFDITKHKRYKELSDYDEKNMFDIEKYLSTRLEMRKDQVIETYDLGEIR